MVSNKTYQNFLDKSLVRSGSKYPIWQRSQPISYKAKFSQRDNIYLVDFKYPKATLQFTWVNFTQNREVCFNQESLPITYHKFCHKSLVRLKSKSPNWQGSQPISYKVKCSQRDKIYLGDLKYTITYQNILGKIKVRPIFIPWNV